MILITGANGQLGTELRYYLDELNLDYLSTDVDNLDITNEKAVFDLFSRVKPNLVFHCAAYTAVDKAEDEGKELNYCVNVIGTKNIARATEIFGGKLVYVSTDYVFDGTKMEEYLPEDKTNPQSEYGKTKLCGEAIVDEFCSQYYIIRTSWVFGNYGHNFVFTMQNLAKKLSRLTVVDDQIGRPTWTRTLAEFMVHVVESGSDYGVYHLSNDGSCSWFEFACEILRGVDVVIAPVSSDEFPQKANRPKHSVMSLEKARAIGFVIPMWQDALRMMLGD